MCKHYYLYLRNTFASRTSCQPMNQVYGWCNLSYFFFLPAIHTINFFYLFFWSSEISKRLFLKWKQHLIVIERSSVLYKIDMVTKSVSNFEWKTIFCTSSFSAIISEQEHQCLHNLRHCPNHPELQQMPFGSLILIDRVVKSFPANLFILKIAELCIILQWIFPHIHCHRIN